MIKKILVILILLLPEVTQSITSFYVLKNKEGHTILLIGDVFQEHEIMIDFVKKNMACITNTELPDLKRKINCLTLANQDLVKTLVANNDERNNKRFHGIKELINFNNNPDNKIINLKFVDPRVDINSGYLDIIGKLNVTLYQNRDNLNKQLEFITNMLFAISKITQWPNIADLVKSELKLKDFLIHLEVIKKRTAGIADNFANDTAEKKLFANVNDVLNQDIKSIMEFFERSNKDDQFSVALLKNLANERPDNIRKKYLKIKSKFDTIDKIEACATMFQEILKDKVNRSTICYTFDLFCQKLIDWLKVSGYELVKSETINRGDDGFTRQFGFNDMFVESFDSTVANFVKEAKNKEELTEGSKTTDNSVSSAGAGAGVGVGNVVADIASAQINKVKAKVERICAKCNKVEDPAVKFKICSGCKQTPYCSVECQKADWSAHKLNCKVKVQVAG